MPRVRKLEIVPEGTQRNGQDVPLAVLESVVRNFNEDARPPITLGHPAGHSFYYLAIDDLDAELKALPYFSKIVKSEDPSGASVIGHSKPVPVPVVGAICWCSDAIAAA